MSAYPTGYDAFTNPAGSDPLNTSGAKLHSTQHGQVNDAIEAIEAELGLSPSGSEATVAARLTAIEGSIGGGGGGGLVLVDTLPFTTSSGATIDGCFDSTYDDYRVLVRISAVGTGKPALNLRFRASSADDTTVAFYGGQWRVIQSGGSGAVGWSAANPIVLASDGVNTTSPVRGMFTFDVFAPALTAATGIAGNGMWADDANIFAGQYAASAASTAVHDGLKIYPASSTISGVVSVYGYEK